MANVQSILQRIQSALRDANADSWPEETLVQAISEAEKVIVNLRPDASARSAEFTCAVGIEQTIAALSPAPNRLLAVKYNRVGSVNGRGIRRVAIGDKDSISPDWRSAGGSTIIREFLHDEREPLIFYVSPPAASGAKVMLSYSSIPAAYPSTLTGSEVTTVSDLYEPMIIEWALYRLFGHDVEGTVNISRSQQHLGNFQKAMGMKFDADQYSSPRNEIFKK